MDHMTFNDEVANSKMAFMAKEIGINMGMGHFMALSRHFRDEAEE
jgi:hypothetical protein